MSDHNKKENPEAELLALRKEIDQIDKDVLNLLSRRAKAAQRVGTIKEGSIYRPEREAQVLRNIAEINPGPLPRHAVQTIYREVMSACLALEQSLQVAYLGPAGTFTQSAAVKHFGSAPNFVPFASVDEVFRAVESGNMSYGVVPVENTTEGAVGITLDLLLNNPAQICGEINVRIHQQLMSKTVDLSKITKVYSHAQSLAQCHEWLNRNMRQVERQSVSSNAVAARLASEEPTSAAIAGIAAAELYGLSILADNIEDEPNNTTRFLVIGQHDAGLSGEDKTSIILSAPNRAGALYELLAPFAAHGVSMTKLESRPARSGAWEYIYYVDFQGHRQDAAVQKVLAGLAQSASFLKLLGSYPVAALAV